jgi:hypothetical protein
MRRNLTPDELAAGLPDSVTLSGPRVGMNRVAVVLAGIVTLNVLVRPSRFQELVIFPCMES